MAVTGIDSKPIKPINTSIKRSKKPATVISRSNEHTNHEDAKFPHKKTFLSNTNASSSAAVFSIESSIELLRRINTDALAGRPKQLENLRPQLIECVKSKGLVGTIRKLFDIVLLPMAKKVYDDSLLNTDSLTARRLLAKLKMNEIVMPGANFLKEESEDNGDSRK